MGLALMNTTSGCLKNINRLFILQSFVWGLTQWKELSAVNKFPHLFGFSPSYFSLGCKRCPGIDHTGLFLVSSAPSSSLSTEPLAWRNKISHLKKDKRDLFVGPKRSDHDLGTQIRIIPNTMFWHGNSLLKILQYSMLTLINQHCSKNHWWVHAVGRSEYSREISAMSLWWHI